MARDSEAGTDHDGAEQGRLLSRPAPPTENGPLGLQTLGLAAGRDSLLYVPAGDCPDQPAPLVVSLRQRQRAARPQPASEPRQHSRAAGAGAGLAGADLGRRPGRVRPRCRLHRPALAWTFERYAVDPHRLAVGGVSDGASYALSLGLTNGDLFKQILAFSPGFLGRRLGGDAAPVLLTRHA